MRCPVCVEKGTRSSLHRWGMSFTTCMGVQPGYYDEDGKWVDGYDPNVTTTPWRCSLGHRFTERLQGGKVVGTDITQRDEECPHWRIPSECETCRTSPSEAKATPALAGPSVGLPHEMESK